MIEQLIEKLEYHFSNPSLLKMALTHRSKGIEHNERLEFLGDAVVNFVIAEILYTRFPQATEGELSRWRATLVNRDALAQLAKDFELGKYLHLGQGEVRSGGHSRHSILSCAMEAIIGAIYLDGGFAAAKNRILTWYKPLVAKLSTAASHKDAKTLLQEHLQSKRMALPTYTVVEISGVAHQQHFKVCCDIEEMGLKTYGEGSSRRRAEQQAAFAMLEQLT